MTTVPVHISAAGKLLDTSPEAFGELRRSEEALDDIEELRRRMDEEGYLYLPGYLDRAEVLAARRDLLTRAVEAGQVPEGPDRYEVGPAHALGPTLDGTGTGANEHPSRSALLQQLLYGGRMVELYERFFGEPIKHFTYTWLRVKGPGVGTRPHMDNVFMNRGTSKLLTAWTPLGDIDQTLGGLAILADSHRVDDIVNDYATRDVDTYCANSDDPGELAKADSDRPWNGSLHADAIQLREKLGLRWLTTDFQAGDLLTFTMFTAHMGLDNNTADRVRLSCDSRYQPASEPADHRWIGPNPSGHGADSKRGLIC
jgi:hypothetical protein